MTSNIQNSSKNDDEWGVIKQLTPEEQEWLEAEAAEKARRDLASAIRYAEMRGRESARHELVSNMLSKGLRIDQIAQFSGLSTEEINSLAAKVILKNDPRVQIPT